MNKKGMTLVEIIISIALISIVLLFIFSLLVTVNDMNKESEINTTYLINKALIIKNIEEDLIKDEEISVEICNNNNCDIQNKIYSGYDSFKNDASKANNLKANKLITITYDIDDYGYLGIYYYLPQNSYVISYIHGDIKATRLLPGFEKYNVSSNTFKNAWTITSTGFGFHSINIPIIGDDGKDYSIMISYYGEVL